MDNQDTILAGIVADPKPNHDLERYILKTVFFGLVSLIIVFWLVHHLN